MNALITWVSTLSTLLNRHMGICQPHLLATVLMMFSLSAAEAKAEHSLLVVANNQDGSIQLTRSQVRNLFMGVSVGKGLEPVALQPGNQLRTRFNTEVIGMAENRIQSYWAQMKFTGRQTPPEEFSSEQELIEYLSQHPGSVGYVSSEASLPDGLQVVYADDL
ncbi:hypothetical protein [Oceanobacter kriegii]|uniref:hypothetical protein n=1 Tax=Oceanobacter kriegii TaxID=64972 RepID=UPI001B7FD663|nr:hypothetical protein [Oceanobacter kriegii]